MILIDSQVGIFNFKENTDDGYLKVTLSIGTVDQNLKLQQGLNARFVDDMRINTNQQQQQQLLNTNTNSNVIHQNQPSEQTQQKQEIVKLEDTLQSTNTIDPKTQTQEREPEFTK